MLLRSTYLALALGLFGLSIEVHEAAAQTSQQRFAQTIPFDCLDRCFADFKTCLGISPRTDPPVTLPNGRPGTVPTPPPFDLCKRARDECEAQCLPPPTR